MIFCLSWNIWAYIWHFDDGWHRKRKHFDINGNSRLPNFLTQYLWPMFDWCMRIVYSQFFPERSTCAFHFPNSVLSVEKTLMSPLFSSSPVLRLMASWVNKVTFCHTVRGSITSVYPKNEGLWLLWASGTHIDQKIQPFFWVIRGSGTTFLQSGACLLQLFLNLLF